MNFLNIRSSTVQKEALGLRHNDRRSESNMPWIDFGVAVTHSFHVAYAVPITHSILITIFTIRTERIKRYFLKSIQKRIFNKCHQLSGKWPLNSKSIILAEWTPIPL